MANIKKSLMNKKGAGARPFVLSLLVAVAIGFLLISFSYNFIHITNPTSDVFDSAYKFGDAATQMQNSMNNFTAVTENIKQQFIDSSPSPLDYVFLIFKGAFYIPYTLLQFLVSGINALAAILFTMLGGSAGKLGLLIDTGSNLIDSMIALLVSGIILTGVFLLIKAIRGGETER